MKTLDLALQFGVANAKVEDSEGAQVGDAIALETAWKRIELEQTMKLIIEGPSGQVYRIGIVNSGTEDSGTFEIESDQGKYNLLPAVAARLGNSVIVETGSKVIISPAKSHVSV